MGTLCANSYRVLFSSLQHYQVVDVSLPSKTDFVKCFLQKISRKRTLNVISFGKTQRIMERRTQFASDSDAASRRDRLTIWLRPCAICHKFRLWIGFTAGRPLGVPYGIAYRRWERKRSQIAKKYTANGPVHRGLLYEELWPSCEVPFYFIVCSTEFVVCRRWL